MNSIKKILFVLSKAQISDKGFLFVFIPFKLILIILKNLLLFILSNFGLLSFTSKKQKNYKIPKIKKIKKLVISKNKNYLVFKISANKRYVIKKYYFNGLPFCDHQCEKIILIPKTINFKNEISRISIRKKIKTIQMGPVKIDIGCGNKKQLGYLGIDFFPSPCVDIVRNIEMEGLPFFDETVIKARAFHFLEHLQDPIKVINEVYRVLVKNGEFEISVPLFLGPWAFADLTHKNIFNQWTFLNYFDHRFSSKSYAGIENNWEVIEQNVSTSLYVKMIKIK